MNLTSADNLSRFELRKQIILHDKKCERLKVEILEIERIYFKLLSLTADLATSKSEHEKLERNVKMIERHAMRLMNDES